MDEKASAETEHGIYPLAESLLLVWTLPHGGAGLGGEWRWHRGPWHTQTQQFLGRSCSSVLLVGGGRQTPSGRGPHRALADRGLWLVTHPGKPKALRWSQYIFGLSTSDRYYGSTFLSWNLKPKALSCWSAEDSQIAKYLVVNLKGNIKKYNLLFIVNYEVAKTFRFGIYIWESGQRTDLRSVSDCRPSSQFLVELEKMGLINKRGTIFACSVLNMGPISQWALRTGVRQGWWCD